MQDIAIFWIASPPVTEINTIQFTTPTSIVSHLGGYYSAIVAVGIVFISPFLYMSFMKKMTRQLQSASQKQSITTEEIETLVKQRIEYRSIYHLFERVEQLEEALPGNAAGTYSYQPKQSVEARLADLEEEVRQLKKLR